MWLLVDAGCTDGCVWFDCTVLTEVVWCVLVGVDVLWLCC